MLDINSNKTLKIVCSDLKTFELYKIIYHTLLFVNEKDAAHSAALNKCICSLKFNVSKIYSRINYVPETTLLVLQEVILLL